MTSKSNLLLWRLDVAYFNYTKKKELIIDDLAGPVKNGNTASDTNEQNYTIMETINQLYFITINGSASWFSDTPCDNYKLLKLGLVIN